MDTLLEAADLARRGEEFVLATVVWRQAPSSGRSGCRAVVTADGEVHGWIGGACAEPVVIRAAMEALADGEPRLLLLGTPDELAESALQGMTFVPISCQSDGALEVYIEPVLPAPHLVVVGRSPMARTLAELARALGWQAEASPEVGEVTSRSMVVVATQGHHDEEALERVLAADPRYVGLVGSAKRGAAVLGYLADRGVPRERLDRVQVPAGLDLGSLPHKEIAVAILAELVRVRAAHRVSAPVVRTPTAVDPVCGMTVDIGPDAYRTEREGTTYYFCAVGCQRAFEREHLEENRC